MGIFFLEGDPIIQSEYTKVQNGRDGRTNRQCDVDCVWTYVILVLCMRWMRGFPYGSCLADVRDSVDRCSRNVTYGYAGYNTMSAVDVRHREGP